MQIVSHRHTIEYVERRWDFHWEDQPGAGFSFDVDENGLVILDNPAAADNYALCLHSPKIIDDGIRTREWSYTEPSIGLCECCGKEVVLRHFTNTCECGADYNSCGQRLAPRSQWGEETGESLGDILRIA